MTTPDDAADIPPPEVVGTYEIAQRLGLSHSYVYQLVRERHFPQPTELRMGKVWSSAQVEDWIRRHRPGQAKS